MKHKVIGLVALVVSVFSPSVTHAALLSYPVDGYGYTGSLLNTWTNDTQDAQDNDVPGDVDWFTAVPGLNLNDPAEVHIGGLQKFTGVSFAIGNTTGKVAKFRFYYPAVQNNAVVYKPLEVKDMDGGFRVANATYRYTFRIPQDWHDISPHVQANNMYYIKMVCDANCANGINGNVQVNQIFLLREFVVQRVPDINCALQPFSAQCLPMF